MALRDVAGQEKAIEILRGILGRQRISSSYLFCGESGIGKKLAAVNFSKALNCLKTVESQESAVARKSPLQNAEPGTRNPEPTIIIDACDECDSCVKIDAGTHPDFMLVAPEDRNIRVEEIRMIDDALSFKPFEGRKKTVIIDDAESMNIAAANAFLKTLEEPPEDSVIILVSSKPDLLPATIRSRCSRINFTPLSTGRCRELLEGLLPEEKIDLAARLSMGRPGAALSADFVEGRTRFLGLLDGMLRAEKDGWASREDMASWFDHASVFLRDMAVLKIMGNPSRLVNMDLQGYISDLGKTADLKVIIYLQDQLSKLQQTLQFNLNKGVTWNFTASLLRKELMI